MAKDQEVIPEGIAQGNAEEEQRRKEYHRLKQQKRRDNTKKLPRKPKQSKFMTEAERLKHENDMDQLLHASQESRELEKHPDALAGLAIDQEVRKKYFDEVVNGAVPLRPMLPKTPVTAILEQDIRETTQEIEPKATCFDEIVVEQERMPRHHSDRPDQLTRLAISRSDIIEKESRGISLVSYSDIVGGEVENVHIHEQFDRSPPEGADELENGSGKSSDSEGGNLAL